MTTHVIYNDLVPVPGEVRDVVNVARYGQVLHQKRPLAEWFRATCESTPDVTFQALTHARDVGALQDRLAARGGDDPTRYAFLNASLVFRSPQAFQILLQKASTVGRALFCQGAEEGRFLPILFSNGPQLAAVLAGSKETALSVLDPATTRVEPYEVLRNERYLMDISRYRDLVAFLQSSYEARFFNRVTDDSDRFLVKTSRDRDKILREYRYHSFLPPRIRCFFVEPFDFEEREDCASYKMEKLPMPDFSTLWLHDALSAEDFRAFLRTLFTFLDLRERRPVSTEAARSDMQALYVDKVRARIAALARLQVFADVDGLVRRHTAYGSVDAVVSRYLDLFDRHLRRDVPAELAFSHGDLCFSNILYDKRLDLLKLIDPRGAGSQEEAYLNPYYDLAKLSHSTLGHYDAINNGQFRLQMDAGLKLRLCVDTQPLAEAARDAFSAMLAERGIPLRTVRLLEVSLFLSMLPLHAENPTKLLALFLNGAAILEQLP